MRDSQRVALRVSRRYIVEDSLRLQTGVRSETMSRFDFHSVSAARQRRLLWIGRSVVVGFACFCAVYYGALFLRGKYQDWYHLYHAMQAVMQGTNPYEAGIKCYLYPPMFAVVFSPLGLLREGVSGFVFACVSASLLACALMWMARETCRLLGLAVEPWRVWAVAAVGLLFNVDKLRGVIYSGQSDHVILALLAGAFVTVRRWPFVAGVLLGLSAVIKFQTVAFLAYFAVRRRWRECAGMLTGIAAGLLAGVPVFGWSTNWQYVATSFRGVASLVGKAQAGVDAPDVNPITWWASVSIPSAVARMTGYPANTWLLAVIVVACAAACVGVVAWLYRRAGCTLFVGRGGASERDADVSRGVLTCIEWSGVIVALVVFSPQAVGRHFSLLVFPMVFAAALLLHPRLGTPRWMVVTAVCIYFAGLTLPPGGMMFDKALEAWKHMGGASWCALIAYFLLVAAGLRVWAQFARQDGRSGAS